MSLDAEKLELIALDPKKFNVLVITLGPRATTDDAARASQLTKPFRDLGGQVLIIPSDWKVEFGTPSDDLSGFKSDTSVNSTPTRANFTYSVREG